MPPRIGLAERWCLEDEVQLKKSQRPSLFARHVRDVARRLRAFRDLNPTPRTGHSFARLVYCQMLRQGYAATTAHADYMLSLQFRVEELSERELELRLERYEEKAALARITRETGPSRPKKRVEKGTLTRLLQPTEHDRPGDVRYRLLWALLLVTGNRCQNLVEARSFHTERLAEGRYALAVQWRTRKGGRDGVRGLARYPFAWALTIPKDLRDLMPSAPSPLPFAGKKGMASRMNKWLRRRCKRLGLAHPVSTSVARDRLATRLRQRVDDQLMTQNEYEFLMDHGLNVSRQHYTFESA